VCRAKNDARTICIPYRAETIEVLCCSFFRVFSKSDY
jgi:hypothetical protein